MTAKLLRKKKKCFYRRKTMGRKILSARPTGKAAQRGSILLLRKFATEPPVILSIVKKSLCILKF